MIIYCTTNLINNRKYIGLDTINDPKYLGSGTAFKLALKKYGKENFRKDILTHCKNLKELYKMEEFYINRLNACKSNMFYNIAIGGQKIKVCPVDQYDKNGKLINSFNSIREVENTLGFNNSKITTVAKGNGRTAYGYIWRYKGDNFNKFPITPQYNITDKHKKILSDSKKGSGNPMYGIYGKDNPKSKKVNQYDLNNNFIKTWDCIADVEKELKIYNVSACCRKIRPVAGGYKWKFFKEIVQSS